MNSNEIRFKKANMPVEVAARAMCSDPETIRCLIRQRLVDWGFCYRKDGSRRYSYVISPRKFYESTGFLWDGETNED